MALTITSNLYALSSQNSLSSSQSALGKSIERLSTGLRINSAADDASGMAISEKMLGQINGLKRASMNAQDGVSYLQTAEGAMEQVSSMLQRMRELAVQASNGIYTTNDRAELQKEFDQLKSEIDRVATSTEFNTRKLINGDGTGLWSTDSSNLTAIMRSAVAEGNYEIELSVKPGTNQILKTSIMSLQDGKIGAEMTSTGTTNISGVSSPSSIASGDEEYTVEVGDASALTAGVEVAGTYSAQGSSWSVDSSSTTITGSEQSGYLEVKVDSVDSATGEVSYSVRFIDAKTGDVGSWTTVTGDETGFTGLTVDGVTGLDLVLNASSISDIQAGDKVLLAVSGVPSSYTTGTDYAELGGGSVQITGGSESVTGPVIFYDEDELTALDNGDTTLDKTDTQVYILSLDASTGNLNMGSITLEFSEQLDSAGTGHGNTSTGTATFIVSGAGDAATTSTQLKDLSNSIDADGNNIFENTQELTIYGNGTQVTINVEGSDTIATLVEKLNAAILDLGMGSDDAQVNNNLVRYITVPDDTGAGTVKGTLVIQTALTGSQGELSFIGDQSLIDMLGIAEIQEATNNSTTVTVRDAHTGNLVGTEVTGDDRVYSVIEGVELVIDSRAGVTSAWDSTNNKIVFTNSSSTSANDKIHLHLVDNRTSLQIGANKGQSIDVSIPQLDVIGLGLSDANVVSQDNAQSAIGLIDNALTKVVSARATVGAQISRLNYTIDNLATSQENLTAARSRIVDVDVASESTALTQAQVLVQSGVAMLAQANQIPQMALQLLQG